MELTAIKKRRIYQSIIEQIKTSIEKGDLKPGDKLPSERDLAQILSVSRSAVREAISVLESGSIVEIFPGIGVYLSKRANDQLLSQIDQILNKREVNLLELLEMRLGVEGQSAYLAAERRTEVELEKIKNAYNALEAAANHNQLGANEDYQFHISIVKASHNSLLLHAVKIFSDKFLQGIQECRSESMKIPGKSEMVLQEHWSVYEAIKYRDPECAQKMMVLHLHSIKERYARYLS
jgi:GntR family transcriptional regulator, transcriptional repressor for pyruvate dehydrogenase complex